MISSTITLVDMRHLWWGEKLFPDLRSPVGVLTSTSDSFIMSLKDTPYLYLFNAM